MNGQLQRTHRVLDTSTAQAESGAQSFLIGWIGDRRVAVPLVAVDRVLRMAALTPLASLAAGIAGVLNLHGEILPVVDPRFFLGLSTPSADLGHHLVVISARTRYIIWLDRAEQVVTAPAQDLATVVTGDTWASSVLRLAGEVITVLSPDALDPGPIILPREGQLP